MSEIIPGENFMKKSQQKSSKNPKMTRLILGLNFHKITSLVLAIWKLAILALGIFTLKKNTQNNLGNPALVNIGPFSDFGYLADSVLQKSEFT